MSLDPRRVKALFQSALDLADPAARAAFLDRECNADAELRRRVDELLGAAERPGTVLEAPLAAGATVADFVLGSAPAGVGVGTVGLGDRGATVAGASAVPGGATVGFSEVGAGPKPAPADPAIGTTIAGRYKLRQAIGEGGMGTVYLAEQVQPVRRQVALKLIRAGMDSRQVLARFESERQALAIMDHPHIARVLDAGSTESGHPFFVMELVRGVPLTDFCDEHRLDLPTRLNLFRQICSAVQHAHQKGIIHRDLKPTNILVEDHDGTPVPKVIDFGLAKATSGMNIAEASVFTAFGTIAGTPLYMAPEQATFNALDVDTRADIYALGVILYELLTGSTPIRRESLQRAALDEVMRVIREDEPPTPSHRISTSEALPSLAANRHVEPVRLGRFVRGDLDWIVMKALAKERTRRYDSAIGLANDVERFLNDEPVTAGPPTARYRTAKFVRRHRGQVVAASLVLLTLVGGVVGTTLGLLRARAEAEARSKALSAEKAQRLRAETQEALARSESAEKDKARLLAEKRLSQVGKMNAILSAIFKDLNPEEAEKDGKPLAAMIGERLDQAAAAMEGEEIGDPLAVSRIQLTLGQTQESLGNNRQAIDLLERSRATLIQHLGPNDPTAVDCTAALAWSRLSAGQYDLAIDLLEPIISKNKTNKYLDNLILANVINILAGAYKGASRFDRVMPLYEDARRLYQAEYGPDHPKVTTILNNMGATLYDLGDYVKAISMLKQALERKEAGQGPNHPHTLMTKENLANAFRESGQIDKAIPLLDEVFEARKAKLGLDHPRTLSALGNRAIIYKLAGQFDRASSMLEQVIEATKAKLGPDHSYTLYYIRELAYVYKDQGRMDEAISLMEQASRGLRDSLGPDHPDTLFTMLKVASIYESIGRHDEAIRYFKQVLEAREARLGLDHSESLAVMNSLADAYLAAGQVDRAASLREQNLRRTEAKLGPDHRETLLTMKALAQIYTASGQIDRGIQLFERLVNLMKIKPGPQDPQTLYATHDLAQAYIADGQPDRGIALLEQLRPTMKSILGHEHLAFLYATHDLAQAYIANGHSDRAAALDEELMSLSRTIPKPKANDHWVAFNAQAMFGWAFLRQKRFEEAMPLLQEGYEGMKRQMFGLELVFKKRLLETLDGLIQLAEARGKDSEAQAWHEEKGRVEALLKLPASSEASAPAPAGTNLAPPMGAKPASLTTEPTPIPTPPPVGAKP